LLIPVAGDDRAVKINGDVIHVDLNEKPFLQGWKYFGIPSLGELPKEPTIGTLGGLVQHCYHLCMEINYFSVAVPPPNGKILVYTSLLERSYLKGHIQPMASKGSLAILKITLTFIVG
jgi:hypothetical protein